jgi:CrcB protein
MITVTPVDVQDPGGEPAMRSRATRPDPRHALLVFFGGAAGSLTRYLITAVTPGTWGQPAAIFVINFVGAFALGWLVEALLRRPGHPDRQTRSRLLLGTGFLGGFTTYSALAVDSVAFAEQGPLAAAFAYPVATLVLGAGATVLGRRLGSRP